MGRYALNTFQNIEEAMSPNPYPIFSFNVAIVFVFLFFNSVANVTKVCVNGNLLLLFLTIWDSNTEWPASVMYIYPYVLIGVKTKKKVLFAIFNEKKFIFVFC